MHIYREYTVHMLRGVGVHTEGREGGRERIVSESNRKKRQYNGWVLLLFTTTCSISRDKAKSTARQLLEDRDSDTETCVSVFFSSGFLCCSFIIDISFFECLISLSEVGLTESQGDRRWGSSKHRKKDEALVIRCGRCTLAGRKTDWQLNKKMGGL